MPKPICDFCSSPTITWRYPTVTFSVEDVTSVSDWAACATCHVLIETDDQDGLLDRSVNTLPGLNEFPADDRGAAKAHLRAVIAPLHDGFRASRQGAAVPHIGR